MSGASDLLSKLHAPLHALFLCISYTVCFSYYPYLCDYHKYRQQVLKLEPQEFSPSRTPRMKSNNRILGSLAVCAELTEQWKLARTCFNRCINNQRVCKPANQTGTSLRGVSPSPVCLGLGLMGCSEQVTWFLVACWWNESFLCL